MATEPAGTHPLISEARELIKQANALLKKAQEAQREARSKLLIGYDWLVQVPHWNSADDECKNIQDLHPVIINATHTIPSTEACQRHIDQFGSLLNPPPDAFHSQVYFRRGGFLCAARGGHTLLAVGAACSNKQWADLVGGRVDPALMTPYGRQILQPE